MQIPRSSAGDQAACRFLDRLLNLSAGQSDSEVFGGAVNEEIKARAGGKVF